MAKKKFSKVELEYIKANFNEMSVEEIAQKLEKEKSDVQGEIDKLTNKKSSPADNDKEETTGAPKEITAFEEVNPYHFGKKDIITALILAVLTLSVFTYTLTPSLSTGDNGELTAAIHFLGIGHAPGYPIYTTLAKLITYIPIGDIAWRTNFFSAFMAAVAVFFVYLILVKMLGYNRKSSGFNPKIHIPAVLGTIAFGVSDNLWSQSVMAEVYTLNIAQSASLVLIFIMWVEKVWKNRPAPKPYYGVKYMLAFAFLYGVALGDHPIIMPFGFAPLFGFAAISFLANKHRYYKHIEVSMISIGVFVLAIILAGVGYLRFIMSLKSNLLFVYDLNPQAVSLSEFINQLSRAGAQGTRLIHSEAISLGSFLDIITAHFRVPGLWSDLWNMWSSSSFMETGSESWRQLNHPYYPHLYHGIFIIFWPLFFVLVWYLVYNNFLRKELPQVVSEQDYISGTTMAFYMMLAAFAIGFLVHIYMPIRARAMPPLNWGQMNEPGGTWENFSYFFNMFHRKQYGNLGASKVEPLIISSGQLMMLIDIHLKQMSQWFLDLRDNIQGAIPQILAALSTLLLVIPGFVNIFKKNKLFGGFIFGGWALFVFPLTKYINPPPNLRSQFFFEVFFIPAAFYMIVMAAYGIQFYIEYLGKGLHIKDKFIKDLEAKDIEQSSEEKEKPWFKRIDVPTAVWTAVFVVFLSLSLISNFKHNNNHNNWSNHDYPYNLMLSLEPNAILATEGGDNQVFGLAYFTMVEHRRPDLKIYDQKGNVFERIYGNLMRTPPTLLPTIRDDIDKMFIEEGERTGRRYYMLWRRPGLEMLGEYYFKPYGNVFRVQPIRHLFMDKLELRREMKVSDFKTVAESHFKPRVNSTLNKFKKNRYRNPGYDDYKKRIIAIGEDRTNYTMEEVSRKINMLYDNGLIELDERKELYSGDESVRFAKMYEKPHDSLEREEDYWKMYDEYKAAQGHTAPTEEAKYWDWLTREIHVNYQFQKIDMFERMRKEYEVAAEARLKKNDKEMYDEYMAIVESIPEKKLAALETAEKYAYRMPLMYFNIAGHMKRNGFTNKAKQMYEMSLLYDKELFQAELQIAAINESLAKEAKTEDEEKHFYEEARDNYERAAEMIRRMNHYQSSRYQKDPTYQHINRMINWIDNVLTTMPNSKVKELKKAAEKNDDVDSYLKLAQAYVQKREIDDARGAYKYLLGKELSDAERKRVEVQYARQFLAPVGDHAAAAHFLEKNADGLDVASLQNRFQAAQYYDAAEESVKALENFEKFYQSYQAAQATGLQNQQLQQSFQQAQQMLIILPYKAAEQLNFEGKKDEAYEQYKTFMQRTAPYAKHQQIAPLRQTAQQRIDVYEAQKAGAEQ